METLDIQHPIRPELLSPRYYLQSLTQEALSCGLMTEREFTRLQTSLLALLARQTDSLTGGESSSVPMERAKDLLASILFVLGVQLKSCWTPEQAVERLKSEPAESLFEEGMEIVRRKMAVARRTQKRILGNLLETPNVYYRSTVEDGINGFFKQYRPQLAAHEIHITADYPVLLGRPELDGIEFIDKYLRCIEAENTFCKRFSPSKIHSLLCALTLDYPNVPLNIFEPVVLSALGLELLGKSPLGLDLTEDDLELLYRRFSGEAEDALQGALSALTGELNLPQISVRYISLCIPRLAAEIGNAVKLNTLDKVFLLPTA